MNVIYKAEIKFPSAETSRDILLEKQFPFLLNKMENNYFSFHIFPTGIATSSLVTTTGCFSYKERINDRSRPHGRWLRQRNCRIHPLRLPGNAHSVPAGGIVPKRITNARANVLLYRFASSMIRASGAVGKSLIVLKHKPNNHNFFKTGFVASVF